MDGAAVVKPRIAVAGFQHETNTNAPLRTTLQDFEIGGGWPGLTRGDAVARLFPALNIPLGGAIVAAKAAGAEAIPILWTSAEPASFVSDHAFDTITGEIIDRTKAAGVIDGLCLDLHGAMVTESEPDGEGALLRRLRAHFPDLPIAVSLDLHANMSAELVDLSDVITIYRSYPHLDMAETGARAMSLLLSMIETGNHPAKAFRQVDFQIPLSAQCTEFGPLNVLYAGLDDPDGGAVTADIALGFPLAEIAMARPAIVAYGIDQNSADRAADALFDTLSHEGPLLPNPLFSPEEGIARGLSVARPGRPAILADVQDNSGAGAMSDTTGLLDAMVARTTGAGLIGAFYDPNAAAAAHEAGLNARINLQLGGRSGPKGVSPYPCAAKVAALSDGRFICKGEMQRDVATDIGPAALLRVEGPTGHVDVVVSTLRNQAIDVEYFRHIGAEPTEYALVAVKSTVHFRADFTPLAAEVIPVASPGYSLCA